MKYRGATYFCTLSLALTITGSVTSIRAEVRDNGPTSTTPQNADVVDNISYLDSAKQAWIKPRQIRCWQRGRLIVEENDLYLQKIGEQVSFSRNNNQLLHMFNFGDTFCIYRQSKVKK